MATYNQIKIEAEKHTNGNKIQSCYIAFVKRKHGLSVRKAPNRIGLTFKKRCPLWAIPSIEKAMKKFNMI